MRQAEEAGCHVLTDIASETRIRFTEHSECLAVEVKVKIVTQLVGEVVK